MARRPFVTAGIVLALCALAAPAAAEVVAINRGTFVYENDIGLLDIAGTQGFRFNARIPRHEGVFAAIDFCAFSEECTPGAVIELGATWGGSALQGGVARLRGVTYDDIGGANSPSGGQIHFSGPVTMPDMDGPTATVTAPFEFAGLFVYGTADGESNTAMLTGGGYVTLYLQAGVGGSWIIQRAEFTFRPVRR